MDRVVRAGQLLFASPSATLDPRRGNVLSGLRPAVPARARRSVHESVADGAGIRGGRDGRRQHRAPERAGRAAVASDANAPGRGRAAMNTGTENIYASLERLFHE